MGISIGNSEISTATGIYCGSRKLRPDGGGGGWKPGANTTAWYKFEGDSKDYSGNSRDASGSVSYATSGSLTYAVFNGSSNYLLANNGISQTNYSISLWVKELGEKNNGQVICTNGSGYNMQPIVLTKSSETNNKNLFKAQYWVGSASYCPPAGTAPDALVIGLNNWYHLVSVRDGSTQYLYVNGQLAYSGSITTNYYTDQWSIGAQKYYNQNYVNCYMSNLIIEDKARTAEEIAAYYNQTKSNYGL